MYIFDMLTHTTGWNCYLVGDETLKYVFEIDHTRKYPLCGYILGVLTHTTAWDWLWGGDVFSRLYVRNSALPCVLVVWQSIWNSDYVVLKSSIHSSAWPRSVAAWMGFWNSDYVVLRLSIHSLASSCSVAVWLAFRNSNHVVLKSSICTLALPQRQWFDWGLRVTQNVYFSLMTHTNQLLLVTFCYTTAGIGVIFGHTQGQTHAHTEGQTDMEVEIVI